MNRILVCTIVFSICLLRVGYAQSPKEFDTVANITDLEAYSRYSTVNSVFVTDTLRGINWFVYSTSANVVDSGIVFPAWGMGGGYWIRQYNRAKGVSMTWWSAVNDGVTDNTNAFTWFNNWAIRQDSGATITLNFQRGTYIHKNPRFTYNIRHLIVNGNGATLENNTTWAPDKDALITASGFGNETGINQPAGNVSFYLIRTTIPNTDTIKFLTPSNAANFSVGEMIAVGSFDQGQSGFPPNLKYFDYAVVTGGNLDSGFLYLDRNLTHVHLSDAVYTSSITQYTGQASVYKIEQGSKFNINQVFNDLTLLCTTAPTNQDDYVVTSGNYIEMNRCNAVNFDPTVANTLVYRNCVNSGPCEFDKEVNNFTDYGSRWVGNVSNATSFNSVSFINSALDTITNFTPRSLSFTNCTVTGPVSIGNSIGNLQTVSITGGQWGALPAYPIVTNQTNSITLGVHGCTYNDSVLTVPDSTANVHFISKATVGSRIDVTVSNAGSDLATGVSGIVTSITSDGVNAYITVLFNKAISSMAQLTIYPEPITTVIQRVNVAGNIVNQSYVLLANDLALHNLIVSDSASYTFYTYGVPKELMINVIKPYTGTSSGNITLSLYTGYPYFQYWDYAVDLTTTGVRKVSPTSSIGFTNAKGESYGKNLLFNDSSFASELRLVCNSALLGGQSVAPIVDIDMPFYQGTISSNNSKIQVVSAPSLRLSGLNTAGKVVTDANGNLSVSPLMATAMWTPSSDSSLTLATTTRYIISPSADSLTLTLNFPAPTANGQVIELKFVTLNVLSIRTTGTTCVDPPSSISLSNGLGGYFKFVSYGGKWY